MLKIERFQITDSHRQSVREHCLTRFHINVNWHPSANWALLLPRPSILCAYFGKMCLDLFKFSCGFSQEQKWLMTFFRDIPERVQVPISFLELADTDACNSSQHSETIALELQTTPS